MISEKQRQLQEFYRQWAAELKETCPQFLCEAYSFPYYLHIPKDWFDCGIRVLVVGEEGRGYKRFDMPIEQVQAFNRDYLAAQWAPRAGTGAYDYNKGPFWNRVRRIKRLRPEGGLSLTWTNLDKIHHVGTKGCPLGTAKRQALHATPTAVLAEEIRILEPTHVVYFGWYGVSLEAELPDVFRVLYPGGLGDDSQWKGGKINVIPQGAVHHIFAYHPGWRNRPLDYEDRVMEAIEGTF